MVGALYELGEMSYRDNNFKEAEEYLTRASKYSGYDWEDVYKSRLQKAISQLKKEMKKKDDKKDEHINNNIDNKNVNTDKNVKKE